jgi:hypothetical protein
MPSQFISINREAVWSAFFAYLKSRLTAAPWAPNTVYAGNAIVTDPQGHLQQATNSGTSGATALTWNDAGGTTTDNPGGDQIVWQDAGAGFVSMGRKHVAPPDLTIADQPALFVVQVKETHIPQKPPGVPTKLILHGFLIIYLQSPVVNEDIGAETLLAATELNALFYALDQALLPDDLITGKFTLGGQVTHCWIEGDTDQDPGILGQQAAAILPVHILVP